MFQKYTKYFLLPSSLIINKSMCFQYCVTICVLAFVESTFLFNTVVIMGTEYQEEVTAGVGMVNAISDIISGPASGKCIIM